MSDQRARCHKCHFADGAVGAVQGDAYSSYKPVTISRSSTLARMRRRRAMAEAERCMGFCPTLLEMSVYQLSNLQNYLACVRHGPAVRLEPLTSLTRQ
jgi:hypothetical protein